jgi:hypothetical protein
MRRRLSYNEEPLFTSRSERTLKPFWRDVRDFAREKSCFNVRDKAFGILGLVGPECRFYPDYSFD